MRGIALAVAGGISLFGSAAACSAPSLSSSAVDEVTIQMGARRPEIPLENAASIAALVRFIKGTWTPAGTPGASDGVIRFYRAGGVAAEVTIAGKALYADQCKRDLSPLEVDELYSLLMEA